jgi:replicative DNA helicase
MSDSIETKTEEWVIGALASNPDLIAAFWERLDESLFVSGDCRRLWLVIREKWTTSGSLDALPLAREAEILGVNVGSAISILTAQPTPCAASLCEMELSSLEEYRTVRMAKAVGDKLLQVSRPEHVNELAIELQACAAPPQDSKNTVPLLESYHKVIEELSDAMDGKPRQRGVQTRLPLLNSATGGLLPGKLWLVTGGTSDGKSVLAMNLVRSFAEVDQAAAVYSWEMPDVDITKRFLADVAGIPLGIFTGDVQPTREMLESLQLASRWFMTQGKNVNLVNASGMNIYDVEADIRIKVLRDKVKCVCIDYLQLVDLDGLDKSREQQVARGCARLYRLASKLGFTLILLSQLNDDGKVRESRAPGMDCDVMLMIQKVMKRDELGAEVSDESRRNILLAKNRGGPRNKVIPCVFMGANARFAEMDMRHYENEIESKRETDDAPKKWKNKRR